jgi:hypothetical protein
MTRFTLTFIASLSLVIFYCFISIPLISVSLGSSIYFFFLLPVLFRLANNNACKLYGPSRNERFQSGILTIKVCKRRSRAIWIAARFWPYLFPKMFLGPASLPEEHPKQPVYSR